MRAVLWAGSLVYHLRFPWLALTSFRFVSIPILLQPYSGSQCNDRLGVAPGSLKHSACIWIYLSRDNTHTAFANITGADDGQPQKFVASQRELKFIASQRDLTMVNPRQICRITTGSAPDVEVSNSNQPTDVHSYIHIF